MEPIEMEINLNVAVNFITSTILTMDNAASLLCLSSVFFIIKNNIIGWPLGFIGSLMMISFYFEQKIFGQMGLFIFFSVMQILSWKEWILARRNTKNTKNKTNDTLNNTQENWQRITLKQFLTNYFPLIMIGCFVIAFILYQLNPKQPPVQLMLDSFTSSASLFAQYLMGKKVVECWLLWNMINIITIIFSFQYTTINIAILYAAYMISAAFGYVEWKKNWRNSNDNTIQNH